MLTMAFVCVSGIAIGANSAAMAPKTTFTLSLGTYPLRDQGTVLYRGVEFKGTNLTNAEVAKILSYSAPQKEADALFLKLEAASITVAEMTITAKGNSSTMRDMLAIDVKGGKVARLSIGGFDATLELPGTGPTIMKTGAMVMEQANFHALLARLAGDVSATAHIDAERIVLSAIDVTIPDKDISSSAPGGNLHRIKLASVELTSSRDAGVLKSATAVLKNLVIEPPKSSKFARELARYGYDKIDIDVRFAGRYDAASRMYVIDELTISAANVGSITIQGSFGGIDPAAFTGDKDARARAIADGSVSRLAVRVQNAGYFERALSLFARRLGKSPQELRDDWHARVDRVSAVPLAADASIKRIRDAVAAFIANPKSLTISADSKGGPIRFGDFKDPKAIESLLSLVEISAIANQSAP